MFCQSREQDLLLMPTTRMMASPLGEGDRPIRLMLIGKHWQESTLYRAADAFERAGDWQKIGTKGSSRTSRRKK